MRAIAPNPSNSISTPAGLKGQANSLFCNILPKISLESRFSPARQGRLNCNSLKTRIVSDPSPKCSRTPCAINSLPLNILPITSFNARICASRSCVHPATLTKQGSFQINPQKKMQPAATRYFVQRSTQSFTVLYQSSEFCGFSTQWPSSGK